nr:unnamed protein product [Callosobruchus analis]
MEVDFGTSVGKTVVETQSKNKRLKNYQLPSMEDIKALNNYLKTKRSECYENLKESFSEAAYINLQKFTLVSLQVFNRRRAGEVQRIELVDFQNLQTLSTIEDLNIINNVSEECQKIAQNYARFTIRGKLGREVPVLLYEDLVRCMNLIVDMRHRARLSENPYIFGTPSTKDKCLDACKLLREISELCGASKPELLRGTNLRNHMATQSILYNLI